jgi:hypothetical protein
MGLQLLPILFIHFTVKVCEFDKRQRPSILDTAILDQVCQ